MRIALLTDSDAFAGTERHIQDLDASLRERGLASRVFCPAASPLALRVRAGGGTVVPVERGRGPDVPAIRAMAGRFGRGEVDLVHAHNGRSAMIAAGAKRLAGCGSAVLTQHFLTPAHVVRRGMAGRASHVVHRWVDRQLDHVIAISDAVRDAVLARGEMASANVTTVHNGIRAPLAAAEPRSVRASLGIGPSSLFLLCAARLAAEKRIDVLIDAMAVVAKAAPQVVCVVAGAGEEMDALQRRITTVGLGHRVRLLGFRDDVTELMAACDAFVLPSDAEPFGLSLVEAMALGKCVIATDAGGPREIVEHGMSGLLARPADAASLADALVRVAGDEALRRKLGHAAAQRFDAKFKSERMAAEVAAVYASVLQARDGSSADRPTRDAEASMVA